MVYNFITSEPEIREKINVNYRYYTIKSFTFALLTEKGDVISREVGNTFITNPLFKKGNFPLKMALGELVDANTSAQERILGRSLGVKIVKLEVEPFGRRAAVDDDRIYNFDPLD
ncbi:hypothetical protein [Alistipes sp. ZOR0009]|jgi:hypothetical protein|uniref:hypothetical protein n=1 Tax=Alistipes sp. ZOR0009 TaxID=1339253 RepID=UPI000648D5B8|nr:hypothetical protein [Alistipes sp. ZOR0009]